MRLKGTHDVPGNVMPAVAALRIATRNEEQGRRMRDHDAANVLWLVHRRRRRRLLDLKTKVDEIRHLIREPWCLVFLFPSVGLPLSRRALLSESAHVLPSVNF